MSGDRKFTFVNDYGETIEAWKEEDGTVRFTHTDADDPGKVYTFNHMAPSGSGIILSADEMHFLLGVWLGKVE